MIYLMHEEKEFERTKGEFAGAYEHLLEVMYDTFKKKGATRDVGSPIHHRMSPISMLSLAQAKCRRIEATLSPEAWERDVPALARVIEESTDIANYMLFIAALCLLLQKEGVK